MAKMVLSAKAAKKDGKRIKESEDFKKASQALEDALNAHFNKK